MRPNGSIAADLVKGAIAGAAATWAMDRVTTWLYERESDAAREREDRARGGRTAYVSAAEQIADGANMELSREQRRSAGTAIHWVLGMAAGAAYAVARRRWPQAARANGLPFGAGFFILVDEVMNPALGMTPGPRSFPWQTHARGFGGHLAFGLVNHAVLEGLDRVA